MKNTPTSFRLSVSILGTFLFLLLESTAQAMLIQVPAGADFFTIPQGRVLCGPAPNGWIVDATRRQLRPRRDTEVSNRVKATVADTLGDCSSDRTSQVKLLVTGPHPKIDPQSAVVWIDSGQLEISGTSLQGMNIGFKAKGISGKDRCINLRSESSAEICRLNLEKGMPADPLAIELRWAPPGGQTRADAYTFDKNGSLIPDENMQIPIGRIIISRLFLASRVADISSGEGRIEMIHPEALSTVQCRAAHCEATETGILVTTIRTEATQLEVEARLKPSVFVASGNKLLSTLKENVRVLRCPIHVVSGRPMRNAAELKVLVRMDSACGKDADALRWTAGAQTLEILRIETLPEGVYVLLRVGRMSSDRLTLLASRPVDASVVALTTIQTREAPLVQTSLSLPRIGTIDFIPKNREALINVSSVEGAGRLVPIPVPGAYKVRETDRFFFIQGEYTSAGYTALQFALRTNVPEPFKEIDFVRLTDPVQRPIRNANIPIPIGASSLTQRPIVELLCAVKKGKVQSIPPGTAPHIPFDQRDSCHLVIHRERMSENSGEQHISIDLSVSTVGGSDRAEARATHRVVLSHGVKPEVMWIHGAKQQFDRINIRVTHAADQADYVTGDTTKLELPSVQWNVVTEDADFKFYATATIPASLYRFSSDPGELGTGPLALNFGLLSRLTWLNSDGHEGLVGLECGVMGMGLATDKDRQLAFVGGLGIAIPIGNPNQPMQAAINIHAWVAYTIGKRTAPLNDEEGEFIRTVELNPWAFIFGPSITVGSVGAFL